jgi:hypothetical protein
VLAPDYIVICRLSGCTVFSNIISQTVQFSEKKLLNIKCLLLHLLSETLLVVRRTERYIIINIHRSSRKVHIILARFERNLNFLEIFLKHTQISNLKKIRSVGAELFHAERTHGKTDRHDEVNNCFFAILRTRLKSTENRSIALRGRSKSESPAIPANTCRC